jgi:hypothetical protein
MVPDLMIPSRMISGSIIPGLIIPDLTSIEGCGKCHLIVQVACG